jgi:DNA-binding CsgD family transcriptional regulator
MPAGVAPLQPPFPGVVGDVIWIVARLNGERIKPFMPPSLDPTKEMIGVLGLYDAPSGSALSPYVRLFGGVTVQGHQSPDSKDAVYIVGDLVTGNALETWRDNYVDTCLEGEPRIWHEGDLLHGSVASGGKEWLHVVVRPGGQPVGGVTGQDAYLSRTRRGLVRHVVSYYGAVAPGEVLAVDIAPGAPLAFAALRPEEILLGLAARELHTTWGEARPLPPDGGSTAAVATLGGRDVPAVLRSVGLTPAEARLAVLYGNGHSAREAAHELGISEHTAKSTLKQVYGKLGVRKQSELGRFVARLQ